MSTPMPPSWPCGCPLVAQPSYPSATDAYVQDGGFEEWREHFWRVRVANVRAANPTLTSTDSDMPPQPAGDSAQPVAAALGAPAIDSGAAAPTSLV